MKLSFVNKGEEFVLPTFTVAMQEELLEQMREKETKKMSEEKQNQYWNKYTVLLSLKQVDKTVSMKNIDNMHPEDFIFIFKKIMSSGRELGEEEKDFQ